jgi:transcription initiation factor TFIID subunit TAF12
MEMADEFIESILDMSCQLAKHKKTETLTVNEIIYSMGIYILFKIFE